MFRLKRRSDYLGVAKAGRRFAAPGVVVQVRRRGGDGDSGGIRYGITASRKVGKAVVRNRVRRRLRAAAEAVLPRLAADGYDYVLIGRAATVDRPFGALLNDLELALQRLRAWRGPRSHHDKTVERR
ncbi:MAG: ribonuclease P protein component [Rhodospirillales bacterium]|nr:MAG: ribonuclease P protein component [Rhodospirillales bacterium]